MVTEMDTRKEQATIPIQFLYQDTLVNATYDIEEGKIISDRVPDEIMQFEPYLYEFPKKVEDILSIKQRMDWVMYRSNQFRFSLNSDKEKALEYLFTQQEITTEFISLSNRIEDVSKGIDLKKIDEYLSILEMVIAKQLSREEKG
jgi:hypothetical protein